MRSPAEVVMDAVLRAMQPVARLLIRHGVTYPALAAALKRVFLDAARAELASRQMAQTDSAITLLSGVHRRDVRNLLRQSAEAQPPRRVSAVTQVVARWLSESDYLDARGRPRRLPRGYGAGQFDALVASVSSDVRPRALLDEMLRLGAVEESDERVRLLAKGFAPREGMAEMGWLFGENVADHIEAAAANLSGDANFLEQSVFVDEITAESAHRLHVVAAQAWRAAFKRVMREAQERFDHDARHAPAAQRVHRARFGVYFFSQERRSP